MQKLLILLMIALPSGALAREWQNQDLQIGVATIGGSHPFQITDGKAVSQCAVASWPVRNPVGILQCSDGSLHSIEMIGDDIRIDGHHAKKVAD